MTTLTVPTVTRETVQPVSRNLFRDTSFVMRRELRPVLRDPFSLIFGMIQPLVFLALFGPLLAGSLGGSLDGGVWQWFVPAILVMTTLFGTSTTGSNLLMEFQTGAHERMLVTPLSYLVDAERTLFSGDVTSTAVLWGWVAALITVALGLTVGIRSMLRSAD